MKQNIENDAWRENIEKAIKNDWSVVPLVVVGVVIAFVLYAGVANVFNVLVEFITSI